jgi:hypothetical protein
VLKSSLEATPGDNLSFELLGYVAQRVV